MQMMDKDWQSCCCVKWYQHITARTRAHHQLLSDVHPRKQKPMGIMLLNAIILNTQAVAHCIFQVLLWNGYVPFKIQGLQTEPETAICFSTKFPKLCIFCLWERTLGVWGPEQENDNTNTLYSPRQWDFIRNSCMPASGQEETVTEGFLGIGGYFFLLRDKLNKEWGIHAQIPVGKT